MKRVLSLDIGTNSIGSGYVLSPTQSGSTGQILHLGARVFPEGVDRDKGNEKPKTQERRSARAMRRQTRRRRDRKRILKEELATIGLLPHPGNGSALEQVMAMDPLELRTKALDQRLELYELGRVFFHLATRRGFLSNRKTDQGADKTGVVKEGISALAQSIDDSGARTIGEFLTHERNRYEHRSGSPRPVRDRYASRQMYLDEFEAIWEAQKQHHPTLLTDERKYGLAGPSERMRPPVKRDAARSRLEQFGIHGLIFFQRALWWPKGSVGTCELTGEPRAPRADRLAQKYRILSEVNNLELRDYRATGEVRLLTSAERATLLSELFKRQTKFKFDAIRKKLHLDPDTIKFNFEEMDARDGLDVHQTDAALRAKNAVGKRWDDLSEETQDRVVHHLLGRGSDEDVRRALVHECGLTESEARGAMSAKLPDGRMAYSRRALRQLVPYLEQGQRLSRKDTEAIIAGHEPGDDPENAGSETEMTRELLGPPPQLTNPYVRQALHEVRRVVNGLIREHGMPDEIRVELARETKLSADQRAEVIQRNNERRSRRERARAFWKEVTGREAQSRTDTDKVILWWEQGEKCVYTGRMISAAQLVSEQIEIDHVLPRWRSLDNSLMNKVVCFSEANREKGNRTPHEWLGGDADEWDRLLQDVRLLPPAKRKRCIQEELDDDFTERRLTDTKYIAREVRRYLETLTGPRVTTVAGHLTAELRRRWNLNTILDPQGSGAKNRGDHRHHAIDALVIALTDSKRVQELSVAHKRRAERKELGTRKERDYEETYPEPWDGFRLQADEAVREILVSHRPVRRLKGGLHKDTIYGETTEPGKVVIRRKLVEITGAKRLGEVRDPAIKRTLRDYLVQHGVDPEAKAYPKDAWLHEGGPGMESGVPIRRVRCVVTGDVVRRRAADTPGVVKRGNNHSIAYFVDEKGRWKTVVTPTWEAIERVRQGWDPVPTEDAAGGFRFSLTANEMVLMDHPEVEGERQAWTVKKITPDGRVELQPCVDARPAKEATRYLLSAVKFAGLEPEKVTVTPTGKLQRVGK